ncbi:hypothetical protein CEXT_5121 [Caerostris extrusa]|uniref:Uncharacterized protein n=1 Tax=Caerostris extrusa TaxID=172846 RepID=A0AAV4S9T6_CAEEX|nr:hypothetical protein CEXT_5121 [Caerostris extrusa]
MIGAQQVVFCCDFGEIDWSVKQEIEPRTHYRLSHCLVSDSEVPKHTAEVPLVRCTERKGTLKNSAGRSDKRGSDSNQSLFWKEELLNWEW